MPTVSVYIKNEDWDAWRALDKPSEFIHNALNGTKVTKIDGGPSASYSPVTIKETTPKIIKTPPQAKRAVESLPKDDNWAGPLWKKGKK